MQNFCRYLVLGCTALFVAIAANMSSGVLSQGGAVYHVAAFWVLGTLVRITLGHRHFLVSLIVLSAFGLLIELSQELIGGPHAAQWQDVLANMVGAMAGLFCADIGRALMDRLRRQR